MEVKYLLIVPALLLAVFVSGCLSQPVDVSKIHTGEPLPQTSREIPQASTPSNSTTTEQPIDTGWFSILIVLAIAIFPLLLALSLIRDVY